MRTPANADGRPAQVDLQDENRGICTSSKARRHTSPAPSADFMGTAHGAYRLHARTPAGFTKKKNLRLAVTRPEARRAPPFFGGGSPSRCRVWTSRGTGGQEARADRQPPCPYAVGSCVLPTPVVTQLI